MKLAAAVFVGGVSAIRRDSEIETAFLAIEKDHYRTSATDSSAPSHDHEHEHVETPSGPAGEGEAMHGVQDEIDALGMCIYHFCGERASEVCLHEHAGQCGLFDVCTKEMTRKDHRGHGHDSDIHEVIFPCAVLAVCTHTDLNRCEDKQDEAKLSCLWHQSQECSKTIFDFDGEEPHHLEDEVDDATGCRDCDDGDDDDDHYYHDEPEHRYKEEEHHYHDEEEEQVVDVEAVEYNFQHCMGFCESNSSHCETFSMDAEQDFQLPCKLHNECMTRIASNLPIEPETQISKCLDFSNCVVRGANGDVEDGKKNFTEHDWTRYAWGCMDEVAGAGD